MKIYYAISLVLGFFLVGNVRSETLVSGRFVDKQQVLNRWFTGGPVENVVVSNSTLVLVNITNGMARGALTYLTSEGHSLQLHPGDILRLTFSYSYGVSDTADWGLLFGFFNSEGKRMTKPDADYNNPIFTGYQGYLGTGIFGEANYPHFRIIRRTSPINNLLSSASFTTLGTSEVQMGGANSGNNAYGESRSSL